MQQVEERSGRKKALLGAKAIFAKGAFTTDCLIRNISAEGARIEVDHRGEIPSRFELVIPSLDKRVQVEIRWRTESAIGVEFLP